MQPSCHQHKNKPDRFLWGVLSLTIILYGLSLFTLDNQIPWFALLQQAVFELVNTMWWGIALGIIMISILLKIPRELIISLLGKKGFSGIVRATFAGVLLDLCSHGILLVASQLYKRGATLGQVMAFLIASPWNSFSLTLVLIALIGWTWALTFIVLSMLIGIFTGVLFERLVDRDVLPQNPNRLDLPDDYKFWPQVRQLWRERDFSLRGATQLFWQGLLESRMIVRWFLFGILLAACIRTFVPLEVFGSYFGATIAGLGLTVLAATVIEVCSEGTTPIAADLLTRAQAPGNSFAFLMTGVSTDYTEVMVLKETTSSWKIALFLPLLTVPQVLLIAWVMNQSVL